MDLMDKLVNVVFATISLIVLFFLLLPYRFFESLVSTAKTLFMEKVTGKVILITGASSGIGEQLAYEYARRGARLALVARREQWLQQVAATSEAIGSPEAIYILGDVSKVEDCKRFVDATVNHFGQLDHLVSNAGVTPVCLFEDYDDITNASPAMDINFWGSVYSSYFAQRHLKKSKGKIIVIASSIGWIFAPRMSFYNSSKAALISFYETLRIEFGTEIGVTLVTPGLIKTEMTEGKFVTKEGKLELDPEMRDVEVSEMPLESAEKCSKAIVDSACRGDKYLTMPSWPKAALMWKVFCPEIFDWWIGLVLMPVTGTSYKDAPSKKITDFVRGLKEFFSFGSKPGFPKILRKSPEKD